MSEAKHTPGPWEWHSCHIWGGKGGLYSADGDPVCVPNTSNDGDTGAAWFEDMLTDHDAALIADAPNLLAQRDELLAALEGLMVIIDESHGVMGYHKNGDLAEWDYFQEVEDAAAAIIKARGEA